MINLSDQPPIKQRENLNKILEVATKIGDNEREGAILGKLGYLSLSLFEYLEAKDYFQRKFTIAKKNGNRKEEGKALHCLGNLYRTTEDYQQAKQHYEEAIAILEEADETEELGHACSEFGRVCQKLREFKKSKTLQKKALEISMKSGNKEFEMSDYRHLGNSHALLGEYDEAKKCYQKALALSRELDDRRGEASTYSELGFFYRDYLNDVKKAESYCKKACEIYEKIGDLPNEGSEKRELGDLYRSIGKYDEARKCHERALAIKKQIGDRRGEGESHADLGSIYQSSGDYNKAKECYEQALAISKETNHLRGQGVDYGNLGTVYQHLGDYDTAYEYHKKALEINIRTRHSEGIITGYLHLGVVYQHRGEYERAEKCCKKAHANSKEIGDRKKEAHILSKLASIQQDTGEGNNAKAYYEQALQISKEIGDVRLEIEINGSLGAVYQSLGDISMAKKYLKKSLAIAKRTESKKEESAALGNLGTLHNSLGEYALARRCFEQALKISRQTCDIKCEMTIRNNLGTLHAYQNELDQALECFKRALQICEQTGDIYGKSVSNCNIGGVYIVCLDIPKALLYLSESIKSLEEMRVSIGQREYFKIGFADKNSSPYQLMVTILLIMRCERKALSFSELARARSLADLMATQYSSHDLPSFDPNRWIDFTNVIRKKSCTCLSFWFDHENLLCWTIKAGKVEIVTNQFLTASIQPQGTSVQDWLENLANQSYRNFLLSQEEHCEDRSLFLRDENIEARPTSKVKDDPTTPEVTEQKKGDKEQPVLNVLYDQIMAPVLKLLEGSEIIIVPDRSLYRVPFAALIDESGKYLSEKFRIRIVPSLTTLKLIQDSPANYHSQSGVLIVGDPDGSLTELEPLPCAREEVEMIGRLLHVHPLTGTKATKQAVLHKIRSASLIHIAAHGDAERGDIALAPDKHIKDKPKKEDFVLTMSDISKVRLRAKLVVLSCCHSGRGQIKAEGVVGIARAFLGSGARSVLVSLWAVDDRATMQFMKQFYGHLVRGKRAGESLHETMKWMRGNPQYCEVRKWAPFMLIGDDVSFNFKT